MDSTKRIFKFQNYDLIKSVGAFWFVIILVNIFGSTLTWYSNTNVTIGPFIHDGGFLSMAGSNIAAIFIFFIVYGIIMYHEDFALAISFGVTRKDFYKSVIVNNLLVSLIFAVIQSVLQIIDKNVVEFLGLNPMVDFGIFNTAKDNIFIIILSLFTLFLIYVSMSNLLGVLQYRFGYKLWIGLGIVVLFGIVLENNYSFITSLIAIFLEIDLFLKSIFTNLTIFVLGFVMMIICYSLGYLLIRKANIKK